MRSTFVVGGLILLSTLAAAYPSAAPRAWLVDGTAVQVRLLGPISSDTSRNGQPLELVVTRDVVGDGEILIRRGTPVAGHIVAARRSRWGFWDHDRGRLAITFHHTTATNGLTIRLRASNAERSHDRVVIDRPGHALQWASEADTFEAYVDGHYEW